MINNHTIRVAAAIGCGIIAARVLRRRAAIAAGNRYGDYQDDDIVDAIVVDDDSDDVVDAEVVDDEDSQAVLTPVGEDANGHKLFRTIELMEVDGGSHAYVYSEPFWFDECGERVYK